MSESTERVSVIDFLVGALSGMFLAAVVPLLPLSDWEKFIITFISLVLVLALLMVFYWLRSAWSRWRLKCRNEHGA